MARKKCKSRASWQEFSGAITEADAATGSVWVGDLLSGCGGVSFRLVWAFLKSEERRVHVGGRSAWQRKSTVGLRLKLF